MRRTLSLLVAACVTSALAPMAGCGFPDVGFSAGDASDDAVADGTVPGDDGTAPADTGTPSIDGSADVSDLDAPSIRDGVAPFDSSSDVGLEETGSDASFSGDAPGSDAPFDAPVPDAHPDAGPVDAGRDAPVDTGTEAGVDCDVDKDGYKATGAACGGNDCCDTDSNANPGQTMYFTSLDGCLSYDYNCDAKLETEIATNIVCQNQIIGGCQGGPGFSSNPACGTPAPYETCVGGLGTCTATSTMAATQACH